MWFMILRDLELPEKLVGVDYWVVYTNLGVAFTSILLAFRSIQDAHREAMKAQENASKALDTANSALKVAADEQKNTRLILRALRALTSTPVEMTAPLRRSSTPCGRHCGKHHRRRRVPVNH